jgi:hypothetical protein
MEPAPPDCCTNQLNPCSERDRVQCMECVRPVCLVHNVSVPVQYSGPHQAETKRLCILCAAALFDAGQILIGEKCCILKRR